MITGRLCSNHRGSMEELRDENQTITQEPWFKSIIKIRSDLIERFYILEESFYSCLFYRCDVGVSTF